MVVNFILQQERRSSLVLLVAAAVALVLANSSWATGYFELLRMQFSLGIIQLDIRHWINEGLMALFFLVIALEVKRETVQGELRTWRKASFPMIAAVGGMVVPAVIFWMINPSAPAGSGWAIPVATDIAIALGVIGLLGHRVPRSLRVFLLTLAIVDDIGAILIITLFYNAPTDTMALLIAAVLALGLFAVKHWRWWPIAFFPLGLMLWYYLLLAGVSGTLAGVVVAFMIPLAAQRHNAVNKPSAAETIEKILVPFTAYIVVPIFVLANAGITFSEISLKDDSSMAVFFGVVLGLLLGKPFGIVLASWLGHTLGIAQKPSTISWGQLTSVGFISGIGFTISILIAGLSYPQSYALQSASILGIFTASILAGVIGLLLLFYCTRSNCLSD